MICASCRKEMNAQQICGRKKDERLKVKDGSVKKNAT